MLSLDSTTLAQYAAASTYDARAQAIMSALPDVVEVKVYNAGALVGSGTMSTPWATIAGPVITVGSIASFIVQTTGTPDPASWYLRFESGTKWLRGTFGFAGSGADFTWSRPVWKAGQRGKIASVSIQTPRFDVRLASFAPTEGADTAALAATAPAGWSTIPNQSLTVGVAYSLALADYDPPDTGTYAVNAGGDTLPAGLTLNADTGVISGTPTTAQTKNVAFDATPTAEADWIARSTASGVLRAIRFDTSTEVTANTLQDSKAGNVTHYTGDFASGVGCLRFAVNNTDGANNGNWWIYLANDQRVFGPAQASKQYYVQYRQKMPSAFCYAAWPADGSCSPYCCGQKHSICSHHTGSNQNNEVVIEDTYQMGAPSWYYQDGSSFARADIWISALNAFRLQNAVNNGGAESTIAEAWAKYGLLYTAGASNKNSGTPDTRNGGLYYLPDEWMTFETRVDFTNGFSAVRVEMWAAHAGLAPVKIASSVVQLGSGNGGHDALWLLPYATSRTSNGGFDTYTLYDEVITSTAPINFPGDYAVTPA